MRPGETPVPIPNTMVKPGETPVPIPNTMVKPREADGTALETVWESRWPPALKKKREVRKDGRKWQKHF